MGEREIVEIRRTRTGPREHRVEFLTAEDIKEQARLARWVRDSQNCMAIPDNLGLSAAFDVRLLWGDYEKATPGFPMLGD